MATSTQLRQQILAGEQDAALAALYGTDPAVLARQRQRYAAALEQFDIELQMVILLQQKISFRKEKCSRIRSLKD